MGTDILRFFCRTYLGGILLIGIFAGCSKESSLSSSPYSTGIKPLVSFLNVDPYPTSGIAGSEVTFYVSGLQGKDTSQFTFFINQEKAKVVSIVDSAVTVMVPPTASSGAGSVLINGENYFGPVFDVEGNVSIDPTFTSGSGTGLTSYVSSSIQDILKVSDGYILVGNFTDYNTTATTAAPINGIVKILSTGTKVASFSALGASTGTINSIVSTGSGYLVGGSFASYDSVTFNINNITRLLSAGRLDTMRVQLINPDPVNKPEDDSAWVPAFNGGISGGSSGSVTKLFADGMGGYIAVGNFAYFDSFYYYRSTVDQFVHDRKNINQFVRFDINGSLDLTYNINPTTGLTYTGTNGYIRDAIQLSNGKIIIVGGFSTFNGTSVGRIAMLASDGQLDPSFNSGGIGADEEITRITYNSTTHKLMLTGYFKNYNSVSAPGVVLINEDGSIDNTFKLGTVSGGIPTFAAQLTSGKILVSGSFTSYDGIYKQGMVFLNPDGSFAYGYNNLGAFVGTINKIVETTTTTGTPAVILVGGFNMVDNSTVGNIVRLEVLND